MSVSLFLCLNSHLLLSLSLSTSITPSVHPPFCCSQIKTWWEREGRGSESAVLPRRERTERWRNTCLHVLLEVAGEAVSEESDDDQVSPRCRRLLSRRKPTPQLQRRKTTTVSRRWERGSLWDGCLCVCRNCSSSFYFKKAERLNFQVTINFQKSFISKHYQSNPPFLSAFRVWVKLMCIFNFKEKKRCPSGLEIPGMGFLFPFPFFATPSPATPATPGRAPRVGSQENI